MPTPEKKYRPYFSLAHLRIIYHNLDPTNLEQSKIIQYLDDFIAQIEFGLRKSAHTTKPAPTLGESLGIQTELDQLKSEEWRYENGKMSPEEEKEFEKRLGLDS